MSVAFRREGDDEHLEPKFEIPIPPGPNLVTARGAALIHAFNFIIDDALEGGVNGSLNLDGHGKSLSFRLLSMTVKVPADKLPRT